MTTSVTRAGSLDEALELLARYGDEGAPLAGGTWIMRAWQRDERRKQHHVALAGLDALHQIEIGVGVRIGALVTHEELGQALCVPAAVAEAARTSAFPAVRSVATVAGNICAVPFPEADLVPALLACEAEVEIVDLSGRSRQPLDAVLQRSPRLPPGALIEHVLLPTQANRSSAYQRLTVRGGGEYPVVSVAVSVDVDEAGRVDSARVALGSIEEQARLSPGAAAALIGAQLTGDRGLQAGEAAAAECDARDGLDAPAWYRQAVLPALIRDTVERLAAGNAAG
jgi:aerobic carbon-monoxide dehydrogenase medium subunit